MTDEKTKPPVPDLPSDRELAEMPEPGDLDVPDEDFADDADADDTIDNTENDQEAHDG